MDPDGPDGGKKKKSSRPLFLNRDIVIKRLHHRQQSKKASPMVLLKDIFEETPDKDRFVGDVMFWKFFEDIDANRIYHTNSVEYRNLKVMFFETLFYLVLLGSVTAYAYNLQSQDVFESRIEQLDYWKGCDTDGNCRIQKVEDVASFWTWMQNELVPLAYTDDVDAPKVAQIETVFENSEFPLYWRVELCHRAAESAMVGQKIKVEKPQKKANGYKVQKSMKCDKDGPWFSCFGTTCPLASFWREDLKAGKTMSSKNFASRVYHRVDKQSSRDAARKAHKDALVFAKSKNG